jgi:hypothetical protein
MNASDPTNYATSQDGPGAATRRDPGRVTFRLEDITPVVGLAAVALTILPRPSCIPVALVMPVVYLLTRDHTRLFVALSTVLIASAPALITGDRSDAAQRDITLAALVPFYARLLTWRDRTGRWDALDPLVLAIAPVWFLGLSLLVVRLFELGALEPE